VLGAIGKDPEKEKAKKIVHVDGLGVNGLWGSHGIYPTLFCGEPFL
jgi:hypothetical protein